MILSHLFSEAAVANRGSWDHVMDNLACGSPPLGTYISQVQKFLLTSKHTPIISLNESADDIKHALCQIPNQTSSLEYFETPEKKFSKVNLIHIYVKKMMTEFDISGEKARQLLADVQLSLMFKKLSHQTLMAAVKHNLPIPIFSYSAGNYEMVPQSLA